MIADRYAAASDLTPDALLLIWRSISPGERERIGVKLLASALGELVASDDGLIATAEEREAACTLNQDAFGELYKLVEAALPQVLHYYPDGFTYEVRDCFDKLIGTVETVKSGSECASYDTHRFRPSSRRHRLGPKIQGEVSACLPEWVWKIINAGGWFGAALPDGRRYPDGFRTIGDGLTDGKSAPVPSEEVPHLRQAA